MLWSDPDDQPPELLRTAQAELRRAGWVLAAVVFVLTLAIGIK
ncbi:morphogenic membrane protein MmpB [Streptomyces sparsus]